MAVTTPGLTRATAVAAVAAGTIFIGVQVHPQLTTASITSTNVLIREHLEVVMAALAVAGITGRYLGRVGRNGVVGPIGLGFSLWHLQRRADARARLATEPTAEPAAA